MSWTCNRIDCSSSLIVPGNVHRKSMGVVGTTSLYLGASSRHWPTVAHRCAALELCPPTRTTRTQQHNSTDGEPHQARSSEVRAQLACTSAASIKAGSWPSRAPAHPLVNPHNHEGTQHTENHLVRGCTALLNSDIRLEHHPHCQLL